MIGVRNHKTVCLCLTIVVFLLTGSGVLTAESVWEGSAAVGRYGEFPATGYYAAANAFPRNTSLVVENLGTGQKTSVIVVDRITRPGLFMLLSRDAAREIGLADSDIAQVRVVVEDTSADLLTDVEDSRALSSDPDVNPAVSAGGIEDLDFLEDYITGKDPEEEAGEVLPEAESVIEAEVEPEQLLPPLEEEPEEEEAVEAIVEETPPAPVLTTEDLKTTSPHPRAADFSLTEVPEAPEKIKSEAILFSFDSDPLIAPPSRGISRSLKAAPEPVALAESPAEEAAETAEVPEYTEIAPSAYPAERIVAAAFEAPEEPYFEAPELAQEEAGSLPAGPMVDSSALVQPSQERLVGLVVAAVPEEPVFETEIPKTTEYTAPSEHLREISYADVPEAPVPEVPEISGTYLASAPDSAVISYSDIPSPPETAEAGEEITEEKPDVDPSFTEPEMEESAIVVEMVPEIEAKPEPEEPMEEEPREELPVPGEVELVLEPADMRPPEPIEEVMPVVEEEPVETAEAGPVEDVESEQEPEVEAETEIIPEPETVTEREVEPAAVIPAGVTLSLDLAPDTHYLQLGVFSEEGTALGAAARIGSGYPVTVQKTGLEDPQYKLLVGPLSPDESGALLYRFRRVGYGDAFVRVTN